MSDDPKDVSENIENIERIDSEISELESKISAAGVDPKPAPDSAKTIGPGHIAT
jgi:hypothetical protein